MPNDNPSSQSNEQLTALAKRLERDPQFMAYVLRQYRLQMKMTEEEMIEVMETTLPILVRLALCKRPDEDSPQFAQQIQQLSAYAHIQAERLEKLLWQVNNSHD